jgi:hypothetical protein
MKTLFLILAVLLTANCFSQNLPDKNVPQLVKEAFKAKYPDNKKVHWELHNKKQYDAEFYLESKENSAYFDETGKWIKTEQEIRNKELPQAVLVAIKREYSGFNIKESAKGIGPDGMKYYALEIKKGKENYDISVSPDGKVIMKVSM